MRQRLGSIGIGALAACAAWATAGAVQAKVSGFCGHEDQRVALIDGVAWLDPLEPQEPAEEAEPGAEPAPQPQRPIRLGFATFPVDAGEVARADDREDAFRDQSWGRDDAARFELTVEEGVVRQQYLWISPGTNLSYSSGELGRLKLGPPQAGRVSGAYRFTPKDGQEVDCDVTFDLALLGEVKDAPPLPGTPLPADGGAPGAAYLLMNKALHAGDIDAMLRSLPAERAAELRAVRSSPDFPKMIAFAQAISPSQVKIVGGRQDGDRAWVEFTAQEDGQARAGTAEMKLESGRWIMLKESTRDPK